MLWVLEVEVLERFDFGVWVLLMLMLAGQSARIFSGILSIMVYQRLTDVTVD